MKLFRKNKDDEVLKITGGKCFYCGIEFGGYVYMVKDHFVPRSRGGKKLVPACTQCNSIKSNLSVNEFREKAGNQSVINRYAHSDHPILTNGLFYFEVIGVQP